MVIESKVNPAGFSAPDPLSTHPQLGWSLKGKCEGAAQPRQRKLSTHPQLGWSLKVPCVNTELTGIAPFNPPPVGMVIERLQKRSLRGETSFQPTPSWDGH